MPPKTPLMADPVIVDLVKEVGALTATVSDLVNDAREERTVLRGYQDSVQKQLEAARAEAAASRAEQAQLNMTLTTLSAQIGGLTKTLGEHEKDKIVSNAKWELATSSARIAWSSVGILGAILTAAAGVIVWLYNKLAAGLPSGGGGSP